jgi:two-component system, OmpR family, sensor kinase
MSSGGASRTWQRLRSLPDRTPLRVKMITAMLALVIIALVVISLVTRAVFSGYLQRQAENNLNEYGQQVVPAVQQELLNPGVFGRGGNRLGDLLDVGSYRTWVLTEQGQPVQLYPGQSFQGLPQVPTSQAWLSANQGNPTTVPGPAGGDSWLVVTQQIPNVPVTNQSTGTYTNQTIILVVGTDQGNISQDVGYLTLIDLLASAAVVIVLAIVGVAVVRASLRPLIDIEQTAASIAGGDLGSRVPDRDPRTEVGRLGLSLNAMLTQIETAFDDRTRSEEAARESEQRMRQFLADASHELRTPLTAIRGFAEYYRQRGGVGDVPDPGDQPALVNGVGDAQAAADASTSADRVRGPLTRPDLDRIMRRLEQESSRMGILVEDMLLLARLDQQRPLERHPVDMITLAADAVHDARVVAPGRDINLTVDTGAAPIVLGDEVRLRQVIGNLMNNALSHTPEGLPIDVRLRSGSLDEWRTTPPVVVLGRHSTGAVTAAGGQPGRTALAVAGMTTPEPVPAVVLEVADSGPGLTPEQAVHVFERFYRADQARTRKSGGAGLGLAIVSALVAAHGGTVWVESPPGGGATFRIAIPLAPEARYSEPDPEDTPEPQTWPGGPEPGAGTEPQNWPSTLQTGHAAEPQTWHSGPEPGDAAEPDTWHSGPEPGDAAEPDTWHSGPEPGDAAEADAGSRGPEPGKAIKSDVIDSGQGPLRRPWWTSLGAQKRNPDPWNFSE